MKKMYINKNQWHIVVIIVGVLLLSFMSWVEFGKSYLYLVTNKMEEAANVEKDLNENKNSSNNVETTSKSNNHEDNKIKKVCNLVDTVVSKINSNWSVYEQSSFSKTDSKVTYYSTGEISSVQVLAGTNGWLFYRGQADGDSIADYEGKNLYSKAELDEIADAALETQEKIENKGIKFAILVPPNKENVYSEYMPDTYSHAEISRTDLLVEYLLECGVNAVSPKNELLNARKNNQLYYSYDTHWNQLGAYIGVKETLASWGIDLPELSEKNISSKALKGNYHYCAGDDLAQIVGLRSILSDEIEYTIDGKVTMDWATFKEEQENKIISHFTNDDAMVKAKIFVVGDSFRSATIPILKEYFSEVYVVHRSFYEADMIDEINPDYLLVEYVERYSGKIKDIDKLLLDMK